MKNNVYPYKPQFYYVKVGLKGVEIILICFRDGSVRIRDLYLSCETSQWNTYKQKHCDETKQSAQWRHEARIQENHELDHD